MITFLIYGLFFCALLQVSKQKKIAAWIVAGGFISIDILYQIGLAAGDLYYLASSAVITMITAALVYSSAYKMVSLFHNACIAGIVLNIIDWILYNYTVVVSDLVYESAYTVLYLYIWKTMLGKGGADVVGRIQRYQFGTSGRDIHASSCVQSRSADRSQVQK